MQTYSPQSCIFEIANMRFGGTRVSENLTIFHPTTEELNELIKLVPKEDLTIEQYGKGMYQVSISGETISVSNSTEPEEEEEEEDYNEEEERYTEPYRYRADRFDEPEEEEEEEIVTAARAEDAVDNLDLNPLHLVEDEEDEEEEEETNDPNLLQVVNWDIEKLLNAKESKLASEKIYQNASVMFDDISEELGLKRIELQQKQWSAGGDQGAINEATMLKSEVDSLAKQEDYYQQRKDERADIDFTTTQIDEKLVFLNKVKENPEDYIQVDSNYKIVEDNLYSLQTDFINAIYNDESDEVVQKYYKKFKDAVLWYSTEEQKHQAAFGETQSLPEYEFVELNEFGEPTQSTLLDEEDNKCAIFEPDYIRCNTSSVTYTLRYSMLLDISDSTESIKEQNQLVIAARRFLEYANDLETTTPKIAQKYFGFRIRDYKQQAEKIISLLLPPLQNNNERLFNRLSLNELLDFCDRVVHYRQVIMIKNAEIYTGISDEELREQAQRLYESYKIKPESIRGSSFNQVVLERLF